MTLEGLHHVTALAGDAQRNLDFYTRSLGLRLVKRTVNYDDPGTHHFYSGTHHFYYGGRRGAPGTLLTFFPWGHARKPRKGAGQAVAVAYASGPDALERWSRARGAAVQERFGERVVVAEDPDGMALELSAAGAPRLEGVTLCETDSGRADALLHDVLGLARAGREGKRARFRVPGGGFIDVVQEPAADPGKMGAGIVHHVALRVPDEAAQRAWRARLIEAGLRVSHVRDRTYFQSIYFRPPGSTLFEIATAGPGFTIDEGENELGRRLCLPPWLEPHRASIERRLSPVVIE